MNMDFNNKKVTVWIAKLPKYITSIILDSNKKLNIGKLLVDKNEKDNSIDIKINLSKDIKAFNIPIDHVVEIKNKEKKLYLIKNAGDKYSIEGMANKECLIKPVINAMYLEYKKNKIKNNDTKKTIKIFDYFSEVKKGERYGLLKEVDILAKKRKIMLQEKKRERLDRKYVLDMIFNAFEQHEFWTVKDLADFTGQPVAYIQELITEICVLNKADHKNSYELKPEYKQTDY